MRKSIIVIILLFAISAFAQEGEISFKGFQLKPTFTIPWGKIEQSEKNSSSLSARLITSVAGGLAIGKYRDDYQLYGISGILILDAMDGKDTELNPNVAILFNLFNQKLQAGIAYNLGTTRDNISRWYMVFSVGITIK